ncbi:MAG: hypothetical protein NC191_05575 [Muribaculaceae bacterium]|nr:hypothetical protein [Muribaculaceae bacterium]
MKRFLLVIFFILAFTSGVYAVEGEAEIFAVSPEDLQENFFKSPMSTMMPDLRNEPVYHSLDDYSSGSHGSGGAMLGKKIDPENMPLFMKMRLLLTDKVSNLTAEKTEDEIAARKEAGRKRIEKLKFWKKEAEPIHSELTIVPEDGSIANSINEEVSSELPDSETLSLESGISEHVTEKQMQLDCDFITFDDETGDMVATGRPDLFIPPQKTRVIADKIVYNEDANVLKAIGNVVVIRDGAPTESDYFEVDMNEETMFMDNVRTQSDVVLMNSSKAIQKDAKLILEDGTIYSEESQIHRMSSRMVGPRFINMTLSEDERSYFLSDPRGNKLHINAEKIYVDARKNHDVFKMKNIEIRRRGKYWFTWPSLTAYTNKDRDYFEANYPELGSRRKVGMFLGPGFVFGGPGGSILKAIPFINYQHSDFGIGGALKYHNTHNTTELGYASVSDIFFMRGHQRLDENLFLQYSANSFMDEWFMGPRMPKYMAEVYYDKSYKVPDFLAEKKGLTFRHRAGFGLMEDNDRNYYGEKFTSNAISTTRLRYMAEIRQALYSYSNPENKFYYDLSLSFQGSAAVYGTGATQFVGRVGPSMHVQYKNWMQDLAYYQAGYEDNSPMPRFDAYRYGRSSVRIAEIYRFNKYLSAGWSGMVNLSDDSPNGKLFQENRFVVAFGPDDLKIRFGYDFVRKTTYFGFDVAFDTKGTTIDYGRLEIKNPERLGQHKKNEERKLAFAPAKKPSAREENISRRFAKKSTGSAKPAVLKYAQVINIEDPDKETIQ